jgi:hypothetical protein
MTAIIGLRTGEILFFELNSPGAVGRPRDVFSWVTLPLLDITDPDFSPPVGVEGFQAFSDQVSALLPQTMKLNAWAIRVQQSTIGCIMLWNVIAPTGNPAKCLFKEQRWFSTNSENL